MPISDFAKFPTALAVALFLAVFLAVSGGAEAQTPEVSIYGPSVVHEGGLVAQQVGGCPEKSYSFSWNSNESLAQNLARLSSARGDYTPNYCEYRDTSGAPRYDLEVVVRNTQAGNIVVVKHNDNFKLYDGGTEIMLASGFTETVSAGKTWRKTFQVSSAGANFSNGGDTDGTVLMSVHGLNDNPRFDFTISEDDNSAYIGRRRHHPYGGTWSRTPHCYTQGCAYD